MNSSENLLDVSYDQDPLRGMQRPLDPSQSLPAHGATDTTAATAATSHEVNTNIMDTGDGIMGDNIQNKAAEQEQVMGGTSGPMTYTNNGEQYSDPGRIVEDHRRMTIAAQNSRSNIVINADSIKEETHVLEEGKNVLQSFLGQVMDNTPAETTSVKPTKVALNAQVKHQHEEQKRRFQGHPSQETKYYNLSIEPCTAKYVVTKVRNWRAGYSRILSLHKTYFTTLDPETNEITNLWYYSNVRNYMALPQEKDCIIIDVVEDNKGVIKLKFKCFEGGRDEALTSFSERVTAVHGLGQTFGQGQQQHPTFMQCQRLTRHNTRIGSALMCAPYGLIELDPSTGSPIRTYYYRCIRGISFLNDDENGIVFHVVESSNSMQAKSECKTWLVFSPRKGGSGRSELVTVLKNKFELFALPLIVSESVGINYVIQSKVKRCQKINVGESMGVFPVRKFSKRMQLRMSKNQKDSNTRRYLMITRNGFLLELDENESGTKSTASCRPLQDIANIVRHSGNPLNNERRFTIEYKGGLCRTYASNEIDAVIVPILDASVNLSRNFNLTVADVPCAPYRMIGFTGDDVDKNNNASAAPTQNIFQQEPIDMQCLRKVHEVSSVSYAYVEHIFHLDSSVTIQQILDESIATIECCRELNANVCIKTACAMPNEKKYIEESINALWGVCSILMKYLVDTSSTTQSEKSYGSIHYAITPIFQTLYRLMMTETGYASTAKNEEVVNAIFDIWCIKDPFALYWSLKCLSVLLLPRPFARERERKSEFINKGFLLYSKSNVVNKLVGCMMESGCQSDQFFSVLVSMVCSNIVESLLCSHHDTTSPDQISSFIKILSTK